MSLHRNIQVFLIAILLVNYVLWIPELIDKFLVSRFIFTSLCCLFGCIWILPKVKRLDLQSLDIVLFAFYALNLVSIAWSKNFGEAIFSAQKYFLLALSYYLFRHILAEHKKYWQSVSRIVLWCTVAALLITSYQLVQTYFDQGLAGKAIYQVIGNSGHKNLAASFLFLLLGLNLYFLAGQKKVQSWHYWLIGWQLLVLFFLRTRAVYLALAAFSVVGLAYYLFSDAKMRRLALRRILPFVLSVGFFGLLFIANTDAGKNYLRYLNPSTYQKSASGSERMFVWYKTLDLIREQPLKGYGTGNWKLFFPSKNIAGGFRLQEKDLVFTRVHNDFLEVWAEVGIFGLLLFLAIFGLPFWAIGSSMRQSNTAKRRGLTLLAAILLGYCIISFFDFPKERLEHQVFLGLLLAIIAVRTRTFFQKGRLSKTLTGKGRLLVLGSLTALLLLNAPVGYYRYLGDAYSKEVLIYMTVQDSKRIRRASVAGHSIWYDLNPMVIPLKWYEGLSYYFEGNYQEARPRLAEAYRLNPYNFNVLNNYGSTLVQLEAYAEAIPLYEQALKINPKFDEGLFNMSIAYYHLGKYQEALQCINRTTSNPEKKAVFLQKVQSAIEGGEQSVN